MDNMILVVKKCEECGAGIMCMLGNDAPKKCDEHTQIKEVNNAINKGR